MENIELKKLLEKYGDNAQVKITDPGSLIILNDETDQWDDLLSHGEGE